MNFLIALFLEWFLFNGPAQTILGFIQEAVKRARKREENTPYSETPTTEREIK